jgi:hypothetical protein
MIMQSTMEPAHVAVSVKGRIVNVPSAEICGRTVVVTGRPLRIARIHDEEWLDNPPLENIDAFLVSIDDAGLDADIFTFSDTLGASNAFDPSYKSEQYDLAVAPLTTFDAWWESLPQESRKNTRKAEKKGVTARLATLDDDLVRGIKALYDETPIRQGRRFWHYGKDLDTIRRENASYVDRSDFVATYFEDSLIGFIKIVYVGKTARIMQILAMNAHQDKKTTNLLLTKAIETCCARGMQHFVYGQYYYGNKGHTPITEFKRRHGFQRVLLNRYFLPLTLKGRAVVQLGLHLGVRQFLPSQVSNLLLDLRARLYRRN